MKTLFLLIFLVSCGKMPVKQNNGLSNNCEAKQETAHVELNKCFKEAHVSQNFETAAELCWEFFDSENNCGES